VSKNQGIVGGFMIPFRIYDRERKGVWIVLNYQAGQDGGHYLVAREDESENDGDMELMTASQMKNCRLVDFLDDMDDD
jgi:hypothetical protein